MSLPDSWHTMYIIFISIAMVDTFNKAQSKQIVHVYSLIDHLSSPETHLSLTSVMSQSCMFIQETESYIKKVSLVFIFVAIVVLFNLLLVNFCCIFVVTFFYPIL